MAKVVAKIGSNKKVCIGINIILFYIGNMSYMILKNTI
jgi:hypothetical protein